MESEFNPAAVLQTTTRWS